MARTVVKTIVRTSTWTVAPLAIRPPASLIARDYVTLPPNNIIRMATLGRATVHETERLLETIRRRGAKTVGLQFPVGLRPRAVDLAAELEKQAGVTCLISADPSFGACDVSDMPV